MTRRRNLLQRLIKQHGLTCRAYARTTGKPCRRGPFSLTTGNGRCWQHGGKSTGPKTKEGRAKALEALARGRATAIRNKAERRAKLL